MTKFLPDWKKRRKKLCEKESGQGHIVSTERKCKKGLEVKLQDLLFK